MTTTTEFRQKLDKLDAAVKVASETGFPLDAFAEEARALTLSAAKASGFTEDQVAAAALLAKYKNELLALFKTMHQLYLTTNWEPLSQPLLVAMSYFRETADLCDRLDTALFGERKLNDKGLFSIFKPGTAELGLLAMENMANHIANPGVRGTFAQLDDVAKMGSQAALMNGEGKRPTTDTSPAQLFALGIPSVANDLGTVIQAYVRLAMHMNVPQLLFSARDLIESMGSLNKDGGALNRYVGEHAFYETSRLQAEGFALVSEQLDRLSRGESMTDEDTMKAVTLAAGLLKERMGK